MLRVRLGARCVASWAGILLSAAFRNLFTEAGAPDVALLAFAGAAALLPVGGSVVSAIGLSGLLAAAWLGAGAMVAAMVMTVIIAWRAP